MTKTELKNPKQNSYLIRRLHNGRTLSVNVPKKMAHKLGLKNDDHMMIYTDEANRLIFQKLEVEV